MHVAAEQSSMASCSLFGLYVYGYVDVDVDGDVDDVNVDVYVCTYFSRWVLSSVYVSLFAISSW